MGISNFSGPEFVVAVVFRHRYRRAPFADPLNWTDYRWDTGPWRTGAPHHWGHSRAGWGAWGRRGRQHRRHPLVLLFVAGLAALLGAKLLSALQSRNTSWAQRGLYAALLLVIVAAFSRNRNRW